MSEQTLILLLLGAALTCNLLYLAGVGARLNIWVIAAAMLVGLAMAVVAGVL